MPVTLSDTADVTGGDNPTGSVTFNLYGPGDTTCAAPALLTNTVTLSGGAATSGTYTAKAAGIYRWTATYGGDSHNGSATSACGAETVTVTAAGAVKGVTTTPTATPTAAPTTTSAPTPTAAPVPTPTGTVKAVTTPTTPTTPNTGADLLGPLALFILGAVLLGVAAVTRRRHPYSS